MLRGFSQSALTLVLAVIVLFGTITPPGTRHRHEISEGGLADHAHHDHAGGGEHHGHDHHPPSPVPPAEEAWHLHFLVFGFEITLPDRCPAEDDGRERERDAELVYLRTSLEAPSSSMAKTSALFPLPLGVTGGVESAGALQTVTGAPPQLASYPLCDRARRERSGVLLV